MLFWSIERINKDQQGCLQVGTPSYLKNIPRVPYLPPQTYKGLAPTQLSTISIDQLLMKWEGTAFKVATWESLSNLEDKFSFEGGDDTTQLHTTVNEQISNQEKAVIPWSEQLAIKSPKTTKQEAST